VPLEVTAIMIGVKDLARSKKFYGEGLGCVIDKDYPNFVSINLGAGSSELSLYERRQRLKTPESPRRGPDFGVSRSTSSCRRAKLWTRLWARLWRLVAAS
jgi:uncharacterized protein